MTNETPQIFIYRDDTIIPSHYYYQAQSFVRIFWADGDDHDIDLGLKEPTIHVVLAKDKLLLSYATIVWRDVVIDGQPYQLYGLGDVMTFPKFRKRGYAGQVVQTATDLIKTETSADFGLLWTEPENYNLYRRSGWEVMPNLTTLTGDPAHPDSYDDESAMVLFCSDKGSNARTIIGQSDIYIGTAKW